MYVRLITCEIAIREFSWAVAHARNDVLPEFLPQGYHSEVDLGRCKIQERIDAADDSDAEVVILGYGLCNNILAGIRAGKKPLVVARAHDCITWFLGSRQRYAAEFATNPGCYYYTAGWLGARRSGPQTPEGATGGIVSTSYDELVAKYGEDNAAYLWEFANAWIKHYSRGMYIRFPFPDASDCRERVQAICARNGWEYTERAGDPDFFVRWLDGPWDPAEYLIVKPGEAIAPTYGDDVITITRREAGDR